MQLEARHPPLRAEKVDATGSFEGGVARFSCDTSANPGKRNAMRDSVARQDDCCGWAT